MDFKYALFYVLSTLMLSSMPGALASALSPALNRRNLLSKRAPKRVSSGGGSHSSGPVSTTTIIIIVVVVVVVVLLIIAFIVFRCYRTKRRNMANKVAASNTGYMPTASTEDMVPLYENPAGMGHQQQPQQMYPSPQPYQPSYEPSYAPTPVQQSPYQQPSYPPPGQQYMPPHMQNTAYEPFRHGQV